GPGPGGLAEGSPALSRARTLAFAGLVMAQLFHVFDCRSERRTIWEVGLLTNPWLVAATATSFGMLLAAVYWPPLARVMETFPLSLKDWLAVLAVAGAGQGVVALQRLLLGGRAAAPRGRPVPGR
ncbi:MAG: cation-translocating P-type ATPase C-terminal domain-containing protein, partial [Bacillota bacterium]